MKVEGERVSGGVRGGETGEFQILLAMWNALESSRGDLLMPSN